MAKTQVSKVVFLTKWWETRGIVEGKGSQSSTGGWYSTAKYGQKGYFNAPRSQGFLTRADAEADVKSKARVRVLSLEMQITKIKAKWLDQ